MIPSGEGCYSFPDILFLPSTSQSYDFYRFSSVSLSKQYVPGGQWWLVFCSLLDSQDLTWCLVPFPGHSMPAGKWTDACTRLSCLAVPGLPTGHWPPPQWSSLVLTAMLGVPRPSRGHVCTSSSHFQFSPLASAPCCRDFIFHASSGIYTNLGKRCKSRENIGFIQTIFIEHIICTGLLLRIDPKKMSNHRHNP